MARVLYTTLVSLKPEAKKNLLDVGEASDKLKTLMITAARSDRICDFLLRLPDIFGLPLLVLIVY